MKQYPVFEFIPFENLIHFTQNDYYKALAHSDKVGNSTPFIEYMLGVIDESLSSMLDFKGKTMSSQERLNYFIELSYDSFSRKDYMGVFKEISTATASRDLKLGVELGFFEKQGDKTNTIYKILKFIS